MRTLSKCFLLAALSAVIVCRRQTRRYLKASARTAKPLPARTPIKEFWRGIPGITMANDRNGQPVAGYATEIRSRWTPNNLYLLFICPYETLNLKPDPETLVETNRLWNWDVAEAFLGTDFKNIMRYREFEVSPHGEWVDLAIDRSNPETGGRLDLEFGLPGCRRASIPSATSGTPK